MRGVEEIGRLYKKDSYFTSSINITSKSTKVNKSNESRRRRLTPGSYNLSLLENQLHGTELAEDLQEEKNAQKRLAELDTENFNEARIDLPKVGLNFDYAATREPTSLSSKQCSKNDIKIKQSHLAPVRKILASRRTLNNYMDEVDERLKSVLYGVVSKRRGAFVVPNKKLCSICGDSSPGSCTRCGSRVCSVACSVVHKESRCSGY